MAAGQPIKVGALGRNLMPTALDRREESLLLLNLAVKCQKVWQLPCSVKRGSKLNLLRCSHLKPPEYIALPASNKKMQLRRTICLHLLALSLRRTLVNEREERAMWRLNNGVLFVHRVS